jgi:hypothetical protein
MIRMKNKLKMILAYFRGFNKPRADIEFDMVDWEFNDDGLCMIDGKETNTNLTINNAIKSLFSRKLKREILDNVSREYSDYWILSITIRPFDNQIIVTAKDYQKFTEKKEKKTYLKRLQDWAIVELEKHIKDDNNFIEIDFWMGVDEGEVTNLNINGDEKNIYELDSNIEEKYYDIAQNIMDVVDQSIEWGIDGVSGSVRIEKNKIEVSYKHHQERLLPSNMRIELTPNNIEDYE